ncbi:MAG: KEOPS complex subunit Cgi121 [Methanosarcinaceae archaeon]|nr:KEOPS complex subunit Cgi121 [Methanosarcinaceae archaeon]
MNATVTLIRSNFNLHDMDTSIVTGLIQIEDLREFLKKLNDIYSANNITIQALNADMIAGERHILFAVKKAINAMKTHTNVANDLGVEIMRYAAGERQIEKAFMMGLHDGENRVLFVLVGEGQSLLLASNALLEIIDEKSLIDYSPSKRESIISQFNITEFEIEAVGEDKIPELVIERVALVDVLK